MIEERIESLRERIAQIEEELRSLDSAQGQDFVKEIAVLTARKAELMLELQEIFDKT